MSINQPIEIIAEIAQAHDGSLGILHSYIDALSDLGVDTIKFQMHYADSESSESDSFRIPFSYVDQTRFDYWKRMEFTKKNGFKSTTIANQEILIFFARLFIKGCAYTS